MEEWHRRRILGEDFHVGWQVAKARSNLAKHGVGFAEAASVLDDPHLCTEEQFAGDEGREKLIGRSNAGRLLAVAVFIGFANEAEGTEKMGFVRVISARRATPAERALYHG